MFYSPVRSDAQYAILPPSRGAVSNAFRNVTVDKRRHGSLMAEMQRFRGRIYAGDGAIRADELTADGRHKVRVDDQSWHVLKLNEDGKVCACLRYLGEEHARGFDDLWVRHAALSGSPVLGRKLRTAVESEMARARRLGLGFGEVGGWAVAEDRRGTWEALRIILSTYALLQLLGGCAGVATATARHHSATILRRIGLRSLQTDGEDLPSYYDPQYRCEMEVLRFDSRYPNPKYRDGVNQLAANLSVAPVICSSHGSSHTGSHVPNVFRGFDASMAQPALVPVA